MSKLEELIQELCPDGVEYKNLGEVTSAINIGINPRKFFKLNPSYATCFYVTVRELNGLSGVKRYEQTDLIDDEAVETINSRANIEVGDILFSNTGTVGKLALVVDKPTNWGVNEGIYVIKPIHKLINSRYLYYCLSSLEVVRQYRAMFTGSTLKHVTQKCMTMVKIPIPPIEVQQEIVRILDSFTELTAELTTELTARKQQFEHYREKLLPINNDANDVLCTSLGAICNFKYGKGNTIPEKQGNYPVYGCNGIVGTFSEYNSEDAPIIGHIGSAGIVSWGAGKHFVTYNGTICTANKEVLNSRYLFYLLLNLNLPKLVKGNQPFLSYGDFSNIKVTIPPLNEQERIVSILDKFDNFCTSLTIGLPAEIEARQKQYEYYRDKLLTFKKLA